jgi:hypothetical protein
MDGGKSLEATDALANMGKSDHSSRKSASHQPDAC